MGVGRGCTNTKCIFLSTMPYALRGRNKIVEQVSGNEYQARMIAPDFACREAWWRMLGSILDEYYNRASRSYVTHHGEEVLLRF